MLADDALPIDNITLVAILSIVAMSWFPDQRREVGLPQQEAERLQIYARSLIGDRLPTAATASWPELESICGVVVDEFRYSADISSAAIRLVYRLGVMEDATEEETAQLWNWVEVLDWLADENDSDVSPDSESALLVDRIRSRHWPALGKVFRADSIDGWEPDAYDAAHEYVYRKSRDGLAPMDFWNSLFPSIVAARIVGDLQEYISIDVVEKCRAISNDTFAKLLPPSDIPILQKIWSW